MGVGHSRCLQRKSSCEDFNESAILTTLVGTVSQLYLFKEWVPVYNTFLSCGHSMSYYVRRDANAEDTENEVTGR